MVEPCIFNAEVMGSSPIGVTNTINKMIKYKVTKNDGSIHDVLLIPIKGTSKYHFVNITKGHICTCEFDNIEDAEKDIQKRLEDKLLKSFTVFNE